MKKPLYISLYDHYKTLIEDGTLPANAKLSSIRRCARERGMSRTTVEAAYMQLAADGYVISKPQSGFYVCDVGAAPKRAQTEPESKKSLAPEIRYDFCSASADPDSFNLAEWGRYVKSALRHPERLLSYGEPQGEADLRREVCNYAARQRGVVCTEEQVVIGAGTQSLLHILCGIIDRPESAVFTGAYFGQGEAVLEDHGIRVRRLAYDKLDAAQVGEGGLIYVSPSHMTQWGQVLSISGRRRLLRLSQSTGSLIIEDDYDSEFRYFSRPVSSLQGMDGGSNVVYIGAFSRLLLPSIRISFMVLPKGLVPAYARRAGQYNQTASKTEQIALCSYIRDGRLYSQIRKQRKLYFAKSQALCAEIEAVFGSCARARTTDSGYLVLMELESKKSADELAAAALRGGVAVSALPGFSARPRLLLCCSGVESARFHEALHCLRDALQLPA